VVLVIKTLKRINHELEGGELRMFIHLKKRGQSTLEYAVIIAVIVGALIAMQVYVKRGIQGRLRTAADDIGESFSPGHTTINTTTTTTSNSTERTRPGNNSTTTTDSKQSQSRISNESVANFSQEYWWPTT
jgi:uncharacterized protein (UPF0333 family)